MPNLVGDGLLLRRLKDEADIGGLLMGRQVIQRLTVEEDTALGRTVGAQGGFSWRRSVVLPQPEAPQRTQNSP